MLFQAAAIAAAAGIAVRHHGDVAQFARHAQKAVQHSPAGDNSAADARAQRQQHQVVHVAPRAHPLFAQRRGVGVVLQNHARLQPPLDLIADRKILQAGQVVGIRDDTLPSAE